MRFFTRICVHAIFSTDTRILTQNLSVAVRGTATGGWARRRVFVFGLPPLLARTLEASVGIRKISAPSTQGLPSEQGWLAHRAIPLR